MATGIVNAAGLNLGVTPITYSASMTPDMSAGSQQRITPTDGNAFTVNAPAAPNSNSASLLILEIRNTTGAPLGAVTWTGFKMASTAWVSPATSNNRSIVFSWNGSFWSEVTRGAADVAN